MLGIGEMNMSYDRHSGMFIQCTKHFKCLLVILGLPLLHRQKNLGGLNGVLCLGPGMCAGVQRYKHCPCVCTDGQSERCACVELPEWQLPGYVQNPRKFSVLSQVPCACPALLIKHGTTWSQQTFEYLSCACKIWVIELCYWMALISIGQTSVNAWYQKQVWKGAAFMFLSFAAK